MMRRETGRQYRTRGQTEGWWAEYCDARMGLLSRGMEPLEVKAELEARWPKRARDGSEVPVEVVAPARAVKAAVVEPVPAVEAEAEVTVEATVGEVLGLEPESGRSPGAWKREVEWVYAQLNTAKGKVNLRTAPSRGAVGLLDWARTNRREFYRDFVTKILPSKAEVEDHGRRFADDGRVIPAAIAKNLAGRLDDEPEPMTGRDVAKRIERILDGTALMPGADVDIQAAGREKLVKAMRLWQGELVKMEVAA